MIRTLQAVFIALVLAATPEASADAQPTVRFDVAIPGAHPEQIERDFVNIVESRLKARAGVFQITSTASESEASIRVVFEKAPTCADLAQIAAIVARAVPQGGSIPKQRLEGLECEP
jgi:multidrug efflux pump subunit AcrB